jgi:integrase
MKDNNASEYTIHFTSKALSFLSKHANLENPDEVKHFIANLQSRNEYKRNLCISYNKFCKHYGIQWQMPFYDPEAQNIKLPTKEKLNMLIANASRPLALKLSVSMETGLRPVELCRLKVKDIDTEHKVINPITAKHGAPKTLKISENLNQRIQEHIIQNKLQPSDNLFKGNSDYYGKLYRAMRNNLAKKLDDPAIHTIRLYDFRHYFCTMTLHKTKDAFFTMNQMGHKKLTTTQKYMHLLDLDGDEWICKGANTIKDATALIEAGFEYVTEMDGTKLFKKRK